MNRWRLMAHIALNAAENGKEHQEVTLANYLEQAYQEGFKAASNHHVTDEKDVHRCEWCSSPATYAIECAEKNYVRYSCGEHGRKLERLADLDLGKNILRKHKTSSQPFAREDVDHGDNCRFD